MTSKETSILKTILKQQKIIIWTTHLVGPPKMAIAGASTLSRVVILELKKGCYITRNISFMPQDNSLLSSMKASPPLYKRGPTFFKCGWKALYALHNILWTLEASMSKNGPSNCKAKSSEAQYNFKGPHMQEIIAVRPHKTSQG